MTVIVPGGKLSLNARRATALSWVSGFPNIFRWIYREAQTNNAGSYGQITCNALLSGWDLGVVVGALGDENPPEIEVDVGGSTYTITDNGIDPFQFNGVSVRSDELTASSSQFTDCGSIDRNTQTTRVIGTRSYGSAQNPPTYLNAYPTEVRWQNTTVTITQNYCAEFDRLGSSPYTTDIYTYTMLATVAVSE